MKPLNEQERTKQFFIFLGFFTVTVMLVVGIMYFPLKYNQKQKNEIDIGANEKVIAEGKAYEKTIKDIDSLYKSLINLNLSTNSQFIGLNGDIAKHNSDFKSSIGEKTIFKKYSEIIELTRQILNDKNELKNDKETLKKELEKKNKDYEKLMKCYNTLGGSIVNCL